MAKARSPAAAYRASSARRKAPPAAGEVQRAKLFANGRSQAVRLPKAFRLPGDEVSIRREGNRIILEPIGEGPVDAKGWPIGFWDDIRRRAKGLHFPDPEPMGVHFLNPDEYET